VFGLVTASAPVTAQEKFPSRPIEIIVPTPPGGSVDIIVRLLTEAVEPMLGQKVVAVNKPGAGGTLGMSALVQAKRTATRSAACGMRRSR
jgi:tripartite-type tricarboxylate transporter receptor subunit TctC